VCKRQIKPETSAKAQSNFNKNAKRATATIFLYLSDLAKRYIQDLRDLVLIQKKLHKVFGQARFTARYNL
jgi:hypothetical protein